MRALSNLRELEESLKDWERYQRYSLEDLKKVSMRGWLGGSFARLANVSSLDHSRSSS